MLRVSSQVLASLMLLLVAACASNSQSQSQERSEIRSTDCPRSLPFRATHLPPGFDSTLHSGQGGGGGDLPGEVIVFHYRGPEASGRFINVFRGTGMYEVNESGASPIMVLDARGEIGEIHDGYGVEFELNNEPRGCRAFSVEAFGVSKEELKAFAEGLRTNPP